MGSKSMKKNDVIKVYDKEGKEKEYNLLAIFTLNGNQYIVYKDVDNKSIKENLFASRIDEFSNNMSLFPLNDEEFNLIANQYKKIIENN